MILGFKQKFPDGAPTLFREKILLGLRNRPGEEHTIRTTRVDSHNILRETHHICPKIHTIREGDRWSTGKKIHMAYGVRTKYYQQFNEGIDLLSSVRSVQKIDITWRWNDPEFDNSEWVGFAVWGQEIPNVHVNNKRLTPKQIRELLINDGFKGFLDFFKWFNNNFNGQIIHWTDHRY